MYEDRLEPMSVLIRQVVAPDCASARVLHTLMSCVLPRGDTFIQGNFHDVFLDVVVAVPQIGVPKLQEGVGVGVDFGVGVGVGVRLGVGVDLGVGVGVPVDFTVGVGVGLTVGVGVAIPVAVNFI